ncbi:MULTISPECIES: hypothetical protein [Priestia]|uniref:Uncharacterized protein n=4 Tax=Priestia TaxID=2800373 RepID=D5DRY4_PRIM1|nr:MULTISPECIES: hypothetical protein [Priestia]KOP74513.1 hypothetical protein AMS61_09305 [Bacillus sp. FJAT-21351]KQU19826.1 hypothetical protein ASG61_05815 [Bacillus sp. Leaf75]MCF6796202.1 hypothetical protein [Bacillus sp. ET1]MCJ7986241.1 hypothetical protein [Priestia sp. OVL9]MDH6654685.1 hypothetical protein [Bacillus sp. PvP124]MDP9575177.1 hypothetical protein [Bacillus sp. 1751]MEB2275991.1 hypothetical protein [Bacillus sp. ILBB4]RFB29714.1 hypothetical protein DZB87_04330 [B
MVTIKQKKWINIFRILYIIFAIIAIGASFGDYSFGLNNPRIVSLTALILAVICIVPYYILRFKEQASKSK